MNLKNGYKVLYDTVDGAERVITASKTGTPEGAEEILRTTIGEYKLIYQNADHEICGSVNGIPAATDKIFTEFNKVFVEATSGEEPSTSDQGEEHHDETPAVEPEVPETPAVDETEEEPTGESEEE